MEKMLMPAEGSYTRDFTGFPEAAPDSLLLVPAVRFPVAKLDAARLFFTKGLGASEQDATTSPATGEKMCRFKAGPTEFCISESAECQGWPGQFYVWVENIQDTWSACKELETEMGVTVIDQAICNADERKADALVLKVPSTETMVVVNQAPKGYPAMLCPDGKRDNLVCVVDIELVVPPGTSEKLLAFYAQTVISAIKKTEQGKCMVMFAHGENIRQSLSFRDDASASSSVPGCEIVVQMASRPKFGLVRSKLQKAGLLEKPVTELDEELTIKACVHPKTGEELLEMQHTIRAPPLDGKVAGA